MLVVESFSTPILGYVVTTSRYHDDEQRILDLYLTTISSLVPATQTEIFQSFHKTSMSLNIALLLHSEAVDFVENFLNQDY
jgi:hypothetical protein